MCDSRSRGGPDMSEPVFNAWAPQSYQSNGAAGDHGACIIGGCARWFTAARPLADPWLCTLGLTPPPRGDPSLPKTGLRQNPPERLWKTVRTDQNVRLAT